MNYTVDQLVNILESYARLIDRDQGKYPAVVLDDIRSSIESVLKGAKA
jgi:hypothetical protein